ncbi:MAG: hypothetical protein RR942_16265 [Romboutsia sp.]
MKINNVGFMFTDVMTPNKFTKLCSGGSHIFIIDIVKDEIISKNMENIYSWINTLMRVDYAKLSRFRLSIHGYDEDIREIYEIPEVVVFIKELFNKKPELFYFLDLDSKQWVLICHSITKSLHINYIQSEIVINKDNALDFISKVTECISLNSKFDNNDKADLISDINSILYKT